MDSLLRGFIQQVIDQPMESQSRHNRTEGYSIIMSQSFTLQGERISTVGKFGVVADIERLHDSGMVANIEQLRKGNHNPASEFIAIRTSINNAYPNQLERYLSNHLPDRKFTLYSRLLGGQNLRSFDVYVFD